jgi:hypothetical protein
MSQFHKYHEWKNHTELKVLELSLIRHMGGYSVLDHELFWMSQQKIDIIFKLVRIKYEKYFKKLH